MCRTYYQGIGAEDRKPDAHFVTADARMNDLAESLIIKAGVRKPWHAKVGSMNGGAPSRDPVLVAILLETRSVSGYGSRCESANCNGY
jgi:hypothetical protein